MQQTQNDLVETLEETLRIQKEGRERRQAAEIEIGHMENDLKQKLMELNSGQ